MKIDLMDINKFIEINNCPEVTNPIILERGSRPTDDGLLSFTKFGLSGSLDRKTIYGYIDLGKRFLHPVAYNALISTRRLFQAVIAGSGYFRIDAGGQLVEDPHNGNNGIDWIYDNWEKFKFEQTGSLQRSDNIGILELDKDLIFVDKWLVIPPFYRDINLSKSGSGRQSHDEINDHYSKLINLVSASKGTEFQFMGNVNDGRVQETLNTIYEELTEKFSRKKGMIKQSLLGKTVDYSTRGVISAGRIKSQDWKGQLVPFGYTAVPLSHLCNLFYPFFINEITTFLTEIFENTKEMRDENNKMVRLKNPMDDYGHDELKQMMDLYIESPESRFNPLRFNTEDGFKVLKLFENDLRRTFTVTDLLFLVANRVCEDKHIYVTRYPVETFRLPTIC